MKLYLDFETQEQIDEQYDLESVLDMETYGRWFDEHSGRARAELRCELDIPFGPTRDETLDVFPAENPDAPVVIFIHGGWWRALSSKVFSFAARGLQANGATVVVTNYSLAPKVSVSEITRQSRAAVAWTYENIARYNGNPERIHVAGHSAGGHQVGMLAVTDWAAEYRLPADVIKSGTPISGLFDLRPFRYSFLQPKLLLTHEVILRESPLFHVPESGWLPPLLLTLGGDESADFHRQTRTFGEAWRAAGGTAETLDQPGRDHITAITDLNDPDSELVRRILELTKTDTAGSPAAG